MRLALLLLVLGCQSSPGDRLYTPLACDEGTADCDGSLATGCESEASNESCCGEVCAPDQSCIGGRARCSPTRP